MTTTSAFKVGDKITLSASVDDFCGMNEQGLILKDQNINGSVSTGSRDCKQISGVSVWFRFAKTSGSGESSFCSPLKNFHDIDTKTTDSNGTCSVEYTVTKQDYDDYLECKNEGNGFKLVTCISNDLGQGIIIKGKSSDELTIQPSDTDDSSPHGKYEIRLKYWETPFYKNSSSDIIQGISNFWNAHASDLTGWSLVSTKVDTDTKEIVLIAEKTGSLHLLALIVLLAGIAIAGFLIYYAVIKYIPDPIAYAQGYKDGDAARKEKDKKAIDSIPDMSTDDKTKAKTAIDNVPNPSTFDIIDAYNKYLSKSLKGAVKQPVIKAPSIVLTDSEFEVTGIADPDIKVEIIQDDRFSIWDIFKGDPFKFLDNTLATTMSDSKGTYKAKLKFRDQDGYRLYALTGGKESERTKVYVLDITTIAAIVIFVAALSYYVYMKQRKRK